MDGFEIFTFGRKEPAVSITKNGVTFNGAAVDKLEKSPYVQLLINGETKMLAVKKISEENPYAVPFYVRAKKGVSSICWNSRKLLKVMCNMTGWDLAADGCSGYKVLASYDSSEEALMIDLTAATASISGLKA